MLVSKPRSSLLPFSLQPACPGRWGGWYLCRTKEEASVSCGSDGEGGGKEKARQGKSLNRPLCTLQSPGGCQPSPPLTLLLPPEVESLGVGGSRIFKNLPKASLQCGSKWRSTTLTHPIAVPRTILSADSLIHSQDSFGGGGPPLIEAL